MASQIETPVSSPSATAGTSAQRNSKVTTYVNQQLEKTRRQVKSTDLISGLLTVFAMAFGFLILAAIWDAWIFPLSTTGRWIGLGLLIGGCMVFAFLAILPLLIRQINPDYAARMIEEAKPSFKNSLLNYVSLRKATETVNPAVFDAVSRQAATDLSSVPVDATVDRSQLIRLGYVLIGLTVFAVGYKMLSPKDPLQTFGRILAPTAKIAQPAIVRISDVEPGDTKIFFGEQLEVTAVVRGKHQPSDVQIEYSTKDGQLTHQRIPMSPAEVPNRYRANLSIAGAGIQQSLTYRVIALDGISPDFDVSVQANPTIAVESLILSPPKYTKLPEVTFSGQGSVDAIEGTRVTVHAVANLPIQTAYIELLQLIESQDRAPRDELGGSQYRLVRNIEMVAEGKSASANFLALLNPARTRPIATHYQLKFISTDGDRNQTPNIYPIKIIPDLVPEIAITHPNTRDVSIAENGALAINIEANDLDFEIAAVTLDIDHHGSKLLSKNLELKSSNGNQRVAARFLLTPSQLRLRAGDTAVFFATASDNRTAPENGNHPDPNISRTENYSITITEPDKAATPQQQQSNSATSNDGAQKNPANGADRQQQPGGEGETGTEDSNGQQSPQGSQTGDSDSQPSESTPSESGQSETGQSETGQSESGQPESGQPESGQSESGQSESGQSESGQPESSKPEDGSGSQSGSSDMNQSDSQQEPNQGEQSGGGTGSQASGSEGSSATAGDQQDGGGTGSDSQNGTQNPQSQGKGAGSQSQGLDGEANGNQDSQNSADGTGSKNPSDNNSSSTASETRDNNLNDGQRQPLSEDASPGEQFRRLQDVLEDQEKQQSQFGPGDAADQNPESSSGNNSNSNEQSRSEAPDSRGSQTDNSDPDQKNPPQNNAGGNEPNQNIPQPGSSGDSDSNPSDPNQGNSGNKDSSDNGSNSSAADGNQDQKSGGDSNSENPTGDQAQPSQDQPSDAQQNASDKNGSDQQKGSDQSTGSDQASDSDPSSGNQDQSQPGSGEQPSDAEKQSDSRQDSQSGSQPGSQPESQSPSEGSDAAPGESQSGSGSPGQSGSPSPGDTPPTANQSQNDSQNQSAPSDRTGSATRGSASGSGQGELDSFAIEQEQANLDHSKKATDLVLSKLNDQKYDPDPKLLEEMNWTPEDLNNFLRRWQEMKAAAERGDPTAKTKYERSLKSLDLRANEAKRTVRQNDDQIEGHHQDNVVIQPPADLAPDFNATLRDINR